MSRTEDFDLVVLGSGIAGQAMAMTVYNGDLIVAGTIPSAGGTPVNDIARWDGPNYKQIAEHGYDYAPGQGSILPWDSRGDDPLATARANEPAE